MPSADPIDRTDRLRGRLTDPPLQIAFVSSSNPNDVGSFSGVLYHMVLALRAELPEIEIIEHVRPIWYLRLRRVMNDISRGRIDAFAWSPFNRYFASALVRRWRGRRMLAISASNAALDGFLARRIPTLTISDATFVLMRNFYEMFSRLGPLTARAADRVERDAIRHAVHCSYSSRWAAESAIRDYGAPSEKVSAISWGCNLPDVHRDEARLTDASVECRLLFVSGDWVRKGGDIVLETLRILHDRGIACRLDVVGVAPPDGLDPSLDVTLHGFLRKSDPDQAAMLTALYRDATFLFSPTRQDCTPMVFAEANAYGTPAMTRDVGGVNGVVEDGVNGRLLATDATAADFADAIAGLWRDRATYEALRASARLTYETRLNWTAWARSIVAIVRDLEERELI